MKNKIVAIMNNKFKSFLIDSNYQNSLTKNIGFLLLRFFVGLALCTVFEKFLPRNGIWGPPDWFIQDTADMGFPFPSFFAWIAILSEFFGGILLMAGLFTRPAALLNAMVTFTATFIYHEGDIGQSGLISFFFLIMCLSISLFGPGKFSLDYILSQKLSKKLVNSATVIIVLLFSFSSTPAPAKVDSRSYHQMEFVKANSSEVSFYVKNNSLLPKKVTFIIYQPQLEGNNTLVKWFLPFQKEKFDLPLKSLIYVASDLQVDKVMQGRRIDNDKPFVVVDEKIDETTVNLNES